MRSNRGDGSHIAMDTLYPLEIRARMFAELSQFVAPRRKLVEIESEDRERIAFNIGIPMRKQLDATVEKFSAPTFVSSPLYPLSLR